MASRDERFRQREILHALQLELFPTDARPRAEADVSRVQGPSTLVDCPVGCLGTTDCLCGQGELSDNPLWTEDNIFTFPSTD